MHRLHFPAQNSLPTQTFTLTAVEMTPSDLLLLADDPTAVLPSPLSHLTLLSHLSSLPPSIPVTSYLSGILTLLSRSPHPPNQEALTLILDKLLSVDWSSSLLLKIVSILRDLPNLDRSRVSELLEKVFDGMRRVDIQDLPILVYQLLILASKGSRMEKREILKGILGFFEGEVKGPRSIVRQIEGTALMHLNFAVKQDLALGNEVIGIVRLGFGAVGHFTVTAVLSIVRVRRFAESAVGVLKGAVVGSYRDYKVSRDCKWLPDKLKEDCLEMAKSVEKAFLRAINESNCGREHVVPSIVQLCFTLLESVHGENNGGSDVTGGLMGIEELGIQLLKTLFEVHDMARNEIIEQCKFRILSLKPQQTIPILKLLDHLVQSYPYPMLEYVSRLKELLDYFTFMHDKTSIHLVRAILPLVKFSRDLQDYIVLVLRKAMFRREETVRTSAINAIIDLIYVENKFKKNGLNPLQDSSSQASCSQQADIPSGRGGSLFQELSGLLRRCLSQQAKVKEIMYLGLMKLVVLDPFIAGPVFDILWPHFLNFYSEATGSLLRIDACFKLENGKYCVVEPLDCLLSCVSWILLLQPHGSDHPSQHSWPCFGFSISQENEAGRASSREQFSNSLSKIRKSLVGFRLEDGLGQSQDPGSRALQGEKITFHAWILLGVIEVFVNTIASELEKAASKDKGVLEKETMELVDTYCLIEKEADLNRHSSGRKGSSKTTTQDIPLKNDSEFKECIRASLSKLSQTRRSFFATTSIHQLLVTAVNSYNAIINGDLASQNHTQSSSSQKLDRCLKLITFSLKVCLRHLKSVSATESGQSGDPLNVLIYGDVKCLGRPIMQLVLLLRPGLKLEKDSKKKEVKGKKFLETKGDQSFHSLLCLNELFKLNSSGTRLSEIVEDLNSLDIPEWEIDGRADASEDIHKQDLLEHDPYLRNMHLFLEKQLKPLYVGYISLSCFQELEVLSELIVIIGKTLPYELQKSYGNWAVGMCRGKTIENPGAARSLVSLPIHLLPPPDDLVVAHEMASELLEVIGTEDKDPIEKSETFPVIGKSTKNAIATMLMQLFENSIADLDWAVSRLKAFSTFYLEFSSLKSSTRFGENLPGLLLEEAIYCRSEVLVNVMSCFTEMNLKDSQAEQFLKLTARFYKLLARMTKLRISPKGCKQLLPGLKFQKLAEGTCKKLTSPLYNFMALVQRNQQENSQHKGIINKIKRENRCIPDLIYQIEDYERYLIQLGKLTKMNLLRHAKRSTARDFKILETKKIATPENEPNQADSASSEDQESGEKSEGVVGETGSEKALSAEDAESEKDDEEMVIANKRVRMNSVVQDSDEEG